MKNKINEMTQRDKTILVIFIFFLAFAGIYVLHGKLQEEKIELETEHSTLEVQRKVALESKMEIDGLEILLDAKKEKMGDIYSRVPDNINSSIDFETLFLGWIDGRNVRVNSFSYGKPESERVVFDTTADMNFSEDGGDPLDIIAGEVDSVEGVKDEEEFIEEDGSIDEKYVVEGDDTGEEGEGMEETAPEASAPAINFAKFNYELELSRYEYTRLLDKINNKSEFYQLQSTEFTQGEDGSPGKGSFNIKVYAYSKPRTARPEEN